MEIVVTPDNQWYTVGDHGAEFATIPRGSIVFNHRQSEELLKYGKVTSDGGRAKALVNGSAFAHGTAYAGLEGGSRGHGGGEEPDVVSIVVGTNKVTGENYSKSADEAKEAAEETVDWIETAIDRLERSIDQLDTKANSAYRSWSERNSNLVSEIGEVRNEISLQQAAYEKYMQAAAAVGLDSSYAERVRNGAIDIETITDEVLKEKIDDYKNYYEAALDCKDAILQLQEQESDLYQQRFDNVATQYEGMLSIIEHEKNMLDEYIAQSEAQGWLISENYYNALISNEKSTISKLKQEKSALLTELQTAMSSGTIAKGSEAWYDMVNQIDEVTLAIEQSNTAILEYQQSIQQLKWEQFDLLQEKISAITEEADFLIELMSNDKLFDDNGKLTDEGSATMGLHGVNYNTYMHQADLAREEAERIKKELAKDPYDQELEARYREMIALQQEYILNAEQEKEAIRDLVSEGIEVELDALQELIDKKNEELESAKDLYEYQKRVEEQTKNIASLRKQLASIENDDSEEAQARIQELRVELSDAEAELEETETDRLIESTEKLLSSLYDEYELILNARLDNLDYLVQGVIDQINADAANISTTLSQKAADVGYELSQSMGTIWNSEDLVGTNGIAGVITMYGDRFSSAQTTTNTALNNINTGVQSMISKLNSIATSKAAEAAKSSVANTTKNTDTTSNKTNTNKTNQTTNSNSGTQAASNDTLMGIAAAIWIYGDGAGWGKDPIRSGKLKEKFGEANAQKVQSYINSYGPSGKLYDLWVDNGKNLNKYKYSAYKYGAREIDESQLAWTQEGNKQEFIVRPSDGAILTPIAKGDSVLNAKASRNIWDMANSPAEFIKNNLGVDSGSIPNNSGTHNSISQNFENITFSLPNVRNYNELISEMQRDPKFEKLILAMTIDQIAGKSKLAKGKAIR